jgi:hypothetical protein
MDPLLAQVLNAARLQKATEFLSADGARVRAEGGDVSWYEKHLANLQAFVDNNTTELDQLLARENGINEDDMTDEEQADRKRKG